jgi:hypothetical protein
MADPLGWLWGNRPSSRSVPSLDHHALLRAAVREDVALDVARRDEPDHVVVQVIWRGWLNPACSPFEITITFGFMSGRSSADELVSDPWWLALQASTLRTKSRAAMCVSVCRSMSPSLFPRCRYKETHLAKGRQQTSISNLLGLSRRERVRVTGRAFNGKPRLTHWAHDRILRGADFQSAVSSNSIRQSAEIPALPALAEGLRIGNPQYSRMQSCATCRRILSCAPTHWTHRGRVDTSNGHC